MAQARSLVMPVGARNTYHVLSRCTRREFLLGGAHEHRKEWAVWSLANLLDGFAIDLQAYAIMDNHVHLVLRPRPDLAASWSARDLAARGLQQFPLRTGNGADVVEITDGLIAARAQSEEFLVHYRERLSSITWFMKLFKQRLARRANAEDECSGHFWESRFLTIPLLDMGAVYGCMAYIDRNPLRAGMVERVADSRYCSVTKRCRENPEVSDGEAALNRHVIPLSKCAPIEAWSQALHESRLSAADYMKMVDPHGRHEAKRKVCELLGLDEELWRQRCDESGLFLGVAVGSRASRVAFARSQGKKIVADKTGLW